MHSWLYYLVPALKPERALLTHIALWIAVFSYFSRISNFTFFLVGLFSFLLFYGAIYLMNDILDYDLDRLDRHNKSRVVASGQLSRTTAGYAAIGIWFVTTMLMWWVFPKAVGILFILWGMNALYSGWLKAIPYVDLLFISWTQPLKFILGSILCGVTIAEVSMLWPLLVAAYCAALVMHTEKQSGKLYENRQRKFEFGKYTLHGLDRIRWSAIIVGYAFVFTMTGSPLFWPTLLTMLFVSFVRFFLPGAQSLSLIEKLEGIFQPR